MYVLAVAAGLSHIRPVARAHLACLDAASGKLLWKGPLASHALALQPIPAKGRTRLRSGNGATDVVHYGNAATVRAGAVYCQPNLGFVARCDARDGVVEWLATYPRLEPYEGDHCFARRLGGAPLAAGRAVIFAPRDRAGAFALDRETGKPLWDNPFVPSHEMLGRIGDLVVFADDRSVAALDAATGQVSWHRRVPEGIVGRPRLAGGVVEFGTPAAIVRLDAATGKAAESVPWGKVGAMPAFAVRGQQLAGVSDGPEGLDRKGIGRPLGPRAASPHGPLRLPLERAWHLPRTDPQLLVPPDAAKLPGRLLLLSEGILECVRASVRGTVEWRRRLRPGYRAIAWAERLLVAVYPQRIVAIDAATGALRWEAVPPLKLRRWMLTPRALILAEWGYRARSWRACLIELRSGGVLWDRDLRALAQQYRDGPLRLAWDGRSVHVVAHLSHEGEGFYSIVCRPSDGTITALPRFGEGTREWQMFAVDDAGHGLYVDPQNVAWSFDLGAGTPHLRHKANLGALTRRTRVRRARVSGPWLSIYQYESYPNFRHTHWILRRADPSYELRRASPGSLRGDTLYEIADQTLTAVDLPRRKEAARCAISTPHGTSARILDFREQGDALIVVSGLLLGRRSALTPHRIQLDAFDKTTGRHLTRHILEDPPYWRVVRKRSGREHVLGETHVAWGSGLLFLTGPSGLFAFATAPQQPTPRAAPAAP